jgi:hypothetical protein
MVTQQNSSLKSAGYDNPAYVARQGIFLLRAAGANGVSAKYVAHANLIVYGLSYNTIAIGNATSSYTFTGVNGSATVAAVSDQISLIVVSTVSNTTGTFSGATATYGPYAITGQYLASGTYTNQVGQVGQIQINGTASGTAALGGIVIPQGSLFYIQGGTDTAASEAITVDYNIQPLAAVPA